MYNKNVSEPMWFRDVSASMGLCLDLGAVLECHPDVVLAIFGTDQKLTPLPDKPARLSNPTKYTRCLI